MDYLKQPLIFKIKKVLRYVTLYGVRLTWMKVKAQRHMTKVYAELPPKSERVGHKGHIGIIGCGKFGYGNIAYYLHKNYGRVIRGAMDIVVDRAASLHGSYGLSYYTDR